MSRRLELDRPFGQGLFARIKHAIISRSATRIVVPHHLLPVLFLVLATPTVLIQVYLTPPIQVADEENHFLRATQISEGHLFSRKMEAGSGGLVDGGAVIFAHAFDGLKFRPDLKIAPPVYGVMSRLRWGDQPPEPTNFANTAIYPFFLYLPASVAIGAGRHAGLSIMDSFYLGRLVTAVVSLGLATLALHLCGQGRTTLFLILCFPMTLSLFASVSQDAMSITLGALAAALWSRYVARRAPMPVAARVTVALALGAVIAARLPLLPLYVLAVMPTWPMSPSGRPRLRDVAAALAGLVPLALGVVGIHLAKVPFRTGDNVSASGQSSWIVEHPREALRVATRTLSQDTFRHLHDMVGMLGWLDTELPKAFYTGMAWCVILAAALDVFVFRRAFIPRWGWLPLFGVVTSIAGVFGALYIAWTPVGASVVDGVQGRYFLVPAIVLALCLPGYRIVQDERITNASKVVQSALCVGVALAILWVVPITLIHRYYG